MGEGQWWGEGASWVGIEGVEHYRKSASVLNATLARRPTGDAGVLPWPLTTSCPESALDTVYDKSVLFFIYLYFASFQDL